ncbi:HoxN/HupN/NixA family nickel/cobalt transporter [Afifella pfennigii]|uniref:HoxN/HupN/NixA family nickel/cobalt transporter n=1 Tax=Afifella pfennigii TaxID=209897 RepID=UPI000554DEDC|nr:sulfite exporter TauE/SafE family protein [Afifella pfennigii]
MDITGLIAEGRANPLLLFAMALALGGLHGLEPGHSKTMIAAYIVAIRGTVAQAALLGVAAAFSHSIIVWVLAVLGMRFGSELIGERTEPFFVMVSSVIILLIALWMFVQTLRAARAKGDAPLPLAATAARAHPRASDAEGQHSHEHGGHGHAHAGHSHVGHAGEHGQGHGYDHRHAHDHGDAHIHDHSHDHHAHDHHQAQEGGEGHLDAHAAAHAREIEARLGTGKTSTWQTLLFGLSGGLIPCPAAIMVLLLCLQLGQFWLGITLVAAFSTGLALTLVAVGAVAALGIGFVSRRSSRFNQILAKAPYASAALVGAIGLVMLYSGWSHLAHAAPA